jgi:hypothetical protein
MKRYHIAIRKNGEWDLDTGPRGPFYTTEEVNDEIQRRMKDGIKRGDIRVVEVECGW